MGEELANFSGFLAKYRDFTNNRSTGDYLLRPTLPDLNSCAFILRAVRETAPPLLPAATAARRSSLAVERCLRAGRPGIRAGFMGRVNAVFVNYRLGSLLCWAEDPLIWPMLYSLQVPGKQDETTLEALPRKRFGCAGRRSGSC